ncbi:MAG: amino acid ABC transporter substrate-binding protein [Acetobacteraceae bacterium]
MVGAQRLAVGILALCLLPVLATNAAAAGVLDHLRQDKMLRIAYRIDAPPFSYQDGNGKPVGFIVSICQSVANDLSRQIDVPSLSVSYVPVTAENRFDVIQQGKADLLCEATTATLSRRKILDFSIATFVDGAGLMIASDGPQSLQAMAGRAIGVLGGTTTEQSLRNTLSQAGIAADITPAATHAEGLAMLDAGKVSAYFADRSILWVLRANSKAPGRLQLANEYLTVEPYALALPRGDEDFRLEVDRALSRIYRSGEIVQIFSGSFGDGFQFSQELRDLYLLSALPD